MRLTDIVHHVLSGHLSQGDLAIDGTTGNGYDTAFLAEKVSPGGKVIGIDIQASAIESTREKLIQQQLDHVVELRRADHASEFPRLAQSQPGQAAAIVFNLGYLPGSDKSIQTTGSSTEIALEASSTLLRPGGILSVTAYRGHPGGLDEAQTVEQWMRIQENKGWHIEHHLPNAKNHPPVLWLAHKPKQTA